MSFKYDVVVSALGTKGDLYPLMGVAKELKQRGLNVTFLTSDHFKEEIDGLGISFSSLGTIEEYFAINSDPRMWDPDVDMSVVAADNSSTILKELELGFNYIAQRRDKKIFLITSRSFCGARVAAKKYSTPQAMLIHMPAAIFSYIAPPAPLSWKIPKWMSNRTYFKLQNLKYFLQKKFSSPPEQPEIEKKVLGMFHKLGVSPAELGAADDVNNMDLLLGLFPEWYGMPVADWPANIQFVGFPFYIPENKKSSHLVDSFIAEKGSPILFTSGSGVQDQIKLFNEGMRICEKLNVPGIFVGKVSDQRVLEKSDLCLNVDFINFEYVLPKCRAIVHHGGIGTMALAIKAGIPQLIRPLKIDQPDNAERIHKLKLGSFLLPRKFNVNRASAVLKNIIGEGTDGTALKKYSAETCQINAISYTCDLIEKKLRELESLELNKNY